MLYLDKATGKQLLGVVKSVDYQCDPPSYAVHIPSLDTTRETVASRLTHLKQARGPRLPPAVPKACGVWAQPGLA